MQVATNTPRTSEFLNIAENLYEQLNRLDSLTAKIKGKVDEIHSTPNSPEPSFLDGGSPSSSRPDMTTILKGNVAWLTNINNKLQEIHKTLEEII